MKGKSLLLAGTALVAAAVAAAPAHAQGASSYEDLLRRVEQLERQNKKTDHKVEEIESGAKAVKWSFENGRPQVSTSDGNFSLALRYRTMMDVASFNQSNIGAAVPAAERDLGAGAVVRRARFGFNGKVWKDFSYEFLWEFGGSGAEGAGLYQASVAYTGLKPLTLQIGVFKPYFSMIENTSSNDLAVIERPGVVNTVVGTFGAGSSRRAGQLTFQKSGALSPGDNLFASAAWTGAPVGTGHGTDEASHIVSRAAYRFYSDIDVDMQLGGNFATILSLAGTVAPAAQTVQLRERPNIRVDGQRLIDTGAFAATGGDVWGLEGALRFQNFMVYGEYFDFNIDRPGGLADAQFDGWYVEGSWILTGEEKRYSSSSATFGNPKVLESVGRGGWGVWEATVRYDVDDLDYNAGLAGFATPAGGIRGGKQSALTLGLNWYLNNNIRIMGNYIMADIDRLNPVGVSRGQDVDIFAVRFHIWN